jgi:RNA polymerase-binding transcription factor
MEPSALKKFSDQLQRQRRALVSELSHNEEGFGSITATGREEFEEQAQREREALVLESLDEAAQSRLQEIDAALSRIEAGTFGKCENCGATIPEDTLRLDPIVRFCPPCAKQSERAQNSSVPPVEAQSEILDRGELPPDLAILDDDELQEHLRELIRNDDRIDAEELQIQARDGIIYLEGALPSEPEHQVLLNTLTDIAGIRDIVDHLEIEPLAWQRPDRSKEEARDVLPGTIANQEPYGATEDINLTQEEAVDYEPPDGPPPPPRRGS